MARTVLLALLVAAVAVPVLCEDVITGTIENFDQLIKDNEFVLAEFYAPWCGHCKNLAPEYEKAAGALKKEKSNIVLVKVDATEEENKPLGERYGVRGFPTLKIFRGDANSPQDYNGPRDADGIVSYLKKQAGPASVPLSAAKEVAELKSKVAAVVGVFKSETAPEFKVFSEVANTLRDDLDFGHAFDAALVEDVKKAPGIVLYKQYDEPVVKYTGKYEKDAIIAWLDAKTAPSLPELDQEPKNKKILAKIFEKQDAKLLAFVKKGAKEEAAFRKILTEANAAVKKGYDIIWVDAGSNQGALQFFGLEEKDTPALTVHAPAEDAKYVKKNVVPKDVKPWIAEYEAGKLERFIKSEEAPKENDGPVKIVTANTFNDIVFGGKNVMVEFYAPWCGHCKSLAPIYEKVGEAFEDDDTVVVAKMDATANDVPDKRFEVRGFPTLVFVKADGSLVPYNGERTEDALTDFIKDNSGPVSKAAEEEKAEEAAEKVEEPAKDEL